MYYTVQRRIDTCLQRLHRTFALIRNRVPTYVMRDGTIKIGEKLIRVYSFSQLTIIPSLHRYSVQTFVPHDGEKRIFQILLMKIPAVLYLLRNDRSKRKVFRFNSNVSRRIRIAWVLIFQAAVSIFTVLIRIVIRSRIIA